MSEKHSIFAMDGLFLLVVVSPLVCVTLSGIGIWVSSKIISKGSVIWRSTASFPLSTGTTQQIISRLNILQMTLLMILFSSATRIHRSGSIPKIALTMTFDKNDKTFSDQLHLLFLLPTPVIFH